MVSESATILVLLTILCSTFIRSTFGFGDALIAMPLLAVFVGIGTATPLVAMLAISIAFIILLGNWRSVRIKSAWRLIVSTLAGIPVGLLFLKGAYENLLKIILAFIIIGFAVYHLFKPKLMMIRSDKLAFVFGFIAGILGGAYNTNGPPVVIYGSLRRWPPESFRATLQGYFFTTGLLIVISHASVGLWTPQVIMYYLLCLPVVFFAIWIGGRLHHTLPKGKFDRYVHILMILVGLFLAGQTARNILIGC